MSDSKNRPIRLLFVGRIDRQKGIDILVNALEKCNVKGQFALTIVGDSVIDDLKIASHGWISLMGWKNRDTVSKLMQESDIVVVPSRWEGFGLVALEAMKNSKMVIASNAGALPEIVINNGTGFIFQANSSTDLERALHEVENCSFKQIKQMGENGRLRYKEHFNYQKMAAKVMDLYRDIQ